MRFFNVLGLNNPQEEYQKEETQTEQTQTYDNKATSSTNHSYFEKKGEVNELRKLFKELMEKAPVKESELQEALKKLIGIMTLGIDLSGIFTEVLMFSYVNDLVCKKMIYLYLINYAKTNDETAIMAINTFLKDCTHVDGRIRGNALKTLCSLQTENSLEFMKDQILKLIDDRDAYVRKIAVMGCLRLYYQDYEYFREKELIDKLYNLIKDPHKSVVICAINVLNEIMISEGGMAINSKIILYLMNRFDDFDSYGKQTILMLLVKYKPQNKQEMFDLMNLLEDNLKKNHQPLCLAIINVFIEFTKHDKDIFNQVKNHVAPKLLILMNSSQDEELYNILKHISLFCSSSAKEFYLKYFKIFYCRANEKTYNQKLKIEILVKLTNKSNLEEIVDELCEYVGDRNQYLSEYSVEGLGKILSQFSQLSQKIMKRLLVFLKIGNKHVINNILEVLKDIVLYIDKIPIELINMFQNMIFETMSQKTAIGILQIIQQKPKSFENAPYLAEQIFLQIQSNKIKVDNHLMNTFLNAIIRVFIERPGESLPILTGFYKFLHQNEIGYYDIDVMERSQFYYALLKENPKKLKIHLQNQKMKKKDIVYDQDEEFLRLICNYGMNDLRIIYQKNSSEFIKPIEYFRQQQQMNKKKKIQEEEESESEEESEESDEEQIEENENVNLLELDDIDTNQNSNFENNQIYFDQKVEIQSSDFQNGWINFETIHNKSYSLKSIEKTPNYYENLTNKINIFTMAHGEDENSLKFYLYAKKNENLILFEMNIDFLEMELNMIIKQEQQQDVEKIISIVENFLTSENLVN